MTKPSLPPGWVLATIDTGYTPEPGWIGANVSSELPDGRVMTLEELVEVAMRAPLTSSSKWHVTQAQRVLASDMKFRVLASGTKCRGAAPRRAADQIDDLFRKGSINSDQVEAARVFLMDFTLANADSVRAMDHAMERVDISGSNAEQERAACRIDARDRHEAAQDYLAEDTTLGIDLSEVVKAVVIHNIAPHVLYGGKPATPGEKRVINAAKSARGVIAVSVALHRLVAFYGLGAGASAKRRRNKPTRCNRSAANKAA